MYYSFFVIVSLIWGGGFYLMKIAGFAFGPLTIGAASTLGGSIVLWGYWAINRAKWHVAKDQILPLLFVSVFSFTFPYAVQPFLVAKIGHGYVGMMVSLVPVLTILVSIPILKVFPSKVQLIGVLIGIIGIVLMMKDGLDRMAEPAYLFLAVLVPICYATSNTLIRRTLSDIPSIVLSALLMTSATVVLTPLSLMFETVVIDDRFMLALSSMFLLSLLVRGLGMALFYRMIQVKGPLFAGLVTYVIPIEALLWSWFDNEKITSTQIAAISIVLVIVSIVQWDIARRALKE